MSSWLAPGAPVPSRHAPRPQGAPRARRGSCAFPRHHRTHFLWLRTIAFLSRWGLRETLAGHRLPGRSIAMQMHWGPVKVEGRPITPDGSDAMYCPPAHHPSMPTGPAGTRGRRRHPRTLPRARRPDRRGRVTGILRMDRAAASQSRPAWSWAPMAYSPRSRRRSPRPASACILRSPAALRLLERACRRAGSSSICAEVATSRSFPLMTGRPASVGRSASPGLTTGATSRVTCPASTTRRRARSGWPTGDAVQGHEQAAQPVSPEPWTRLGPGRRCGLPPRPPHRHGNRWRRFWRGGWPMRWMPASTTIRRWLAGYGDLA